MGRKRKGCFMATLEHVSSNLRLMGHDASLGPVAIRTFTGIRQNPTPQGVNAFLLGVNSLMTVQAFNAVHTARAAFVEGGGG